MKHSTEVKWLVPLDEPVSPYSNPEGHLLHHTLTGDPFSLSPFDYFRNDGLGHSRQWLKHLLEHRGEVSPGSQSHLHTAIKSRAITCWGKKTTTLTDKNHAKGVHRKKYKWEERIEKMAHAYTCVSSAWLSSVLAQPGSPLSCLIWVQFNRDVSLEQSCVTVWFQAVSSLWFKRKGKVFTWSVYD